MADKAYQAFVFGLSARQIMIMGCFTSGEVLILCNENHVFNTWFSYFNMESNLDMDKFRPNPIHIVLGVWRYEKQTNNPV